MVFGISAFIRIEKQIPRSPQFYNDLLHQVTSNYAFLLKIFTIERILEYIAKHEFSFPTYQVVK